MKKPTDIERLKERGETIEFHESEIDTSKELYLITWAPDPKELPNADFSLQHLFSVDILADFLKGCRCGLFCVESTQLGNPHYHGWYQTSVQSEKEKYRITIAKVLQKIGLLKITKSIGHYRINSYTAHANCLHYYKKDCLGNMLFVDMNPITRESKCQVDWNLNTFFFYVEGKKSVYNVKDKMTNKEHYKQFYNDSNPL